MTHSKPLVSVATCCEKVLVERDGVTSAIRIVDTFYVPESPTGEGIAQHVAVPVSVLIVLKSGDVVGESDISLQLNAPDGTVIAFPDRFPLLLTGGEQGANINVNFLLPAQKPGLYWLEVLWGVDVLTKIPIKLVRVAAIPPAEVEQRKYPS